MKTNPSSSSPKTKKLVRSKAESMIELSLFCEKCNRSTTERKLNKSLKSDSRDICTDCGAYGPLPTPIVKPDDVISSRAEVRKKWKYKKYTEIQAIELGEDLLNYVAEVQHLSAFTDFLNNICKMSYTRLIRMSEACPELADSIEVAKQIIADRYRERWESDEKMDINKLAPKFLDLYDPMVREQIDRKAKLEQSVGQGIPYFDSQYPALRKVE